MADVQITCVTMSPGGSRHEHIAGVGGTGGGGWWLPVKDVIASIDAKTNTFYTFEGGYRAEVLVVNGPTGRYLRTYADGQPRDNLLHLAPCRR